MKFLTATAVVLALLFLAGNSYAQSSTPIRRDPGNGSVHSTLPIVDLPFFFPTGIKQTIDPVEQRQEYERIFASTWYCNQGGNPPLTMMAEPGSISVQTDVVSTSSVTENPVKMRLVLDDFVRQPDGRIRVTTLCGQYYITETQEKVVEAWMINHVIEASKADNDFYATIMQLSVTARANKLGIPEADFAKSLDEPMIDNKNITYREFNRIPKPSKSSDFVPRELHLGYNPPLGGILGVTWLNTGVIYFNPEALMVDYVITRPVILQHEMVHVNINTEKFPMTEAFDAELAADMPMTLYPENQINLPDHGYNADLREIFWIYFNDDFDEARKQSYKVDLAGNPVLDEAKYRYYFEQHQKVKAEAMKFFQTVTIPEFYSDIAWWGSVNDIRGDKNSVFRMTLALHYNPTILGSSKDSLEWAESHREEILDAARKGFKDAVGGANTNDVDNDITMERVPTYLIDMYQRIFTPEEREVIEAYYKTHPQELVKLKTMSPEQLIGLAQQFKSMAKSTENGVAK
jgi:hypothetical protein